MAEKKRPARIDVHPAVMAGIEKHAYSNLEAEVGGVFYGKISGKTTTINGSVPASKASAEQMTLTFTHEVWDDIYKQGEKNFPGDQIVGWYHTHPSFGLFLSEYDQFIQKNFFSNAGQLALVVDPIAGNMGWFELKKNETVMFYEELTKSGPRARKSESASTSKGGSRVGLVAAISAVLAGSVTWGVTTAFTPPNLEVALANKEAEASFYHAQVYDLQTQLGDTDRGLNFEYTVRNGDTKDSIAKMFFGSVAAVKSLIQDNPGLKNAEPKVGDLLTIVAPLGMQRIAPPAPAETPTPTPSTKPTTSSKPTNSPSAKQTKAPLIPGSNDTSKDGK